MKSIDIVENYFKNGLEIYIITKDGERIDISWRVAVNGKIKNELKSSMRYVIDEQIKDFKNNNNKYCILCETKEFKNELNEFHVDHQIHFEELVQNFLKYCKENEIEIPSTFIDSTDGSNRKDLLECEFRRKWIKYHKDNAILRYLCKYHNLTRKKF